MPPANSKPGTRCENYWGVEIAERLAIGIRAHPTPLIYQNGKGTESAKDRLRMSEICIASHKIAKSL